MNPTSLLWSYKQQLLFRAENQRLHVLVEDFKSREEAAEHKIAQLKKECHNRMLKIEQYKKQAQQAEDRVLKQKQQAEQRIWDNKQKYKKKLLQARKKYRGFSEDAMLALQNMSNPEGKLLKDFS